MKYYTTSLDKFNRISTPLVVALAVGTPVVLLLTAFKNGEPLTYGALGGVLLVLCTALGASYAYRPKDYAFDGETFYINRLIGALAIDLTEIKSVKQLSPGRSIFSAGLRVFGTAGFFGYYGYFWNRELGNYALYAGNLKNPILITTYKGDFYMVSPDESDLYLDLQNAKNGKTNAL